jgi:MerR HTH family regulatory protein
MFRLDFRVGGKYLSAKPVGRQVLDRESPSEKAEDRPAPPADTPADPVSAAPKGFPLFWVSRPGEDGEDRATSAEKEAFFASAAYRESWRAYLAATSPRGEAESLPPAEQSESPPARTGGRPRKTGPDDEPITRGYVAQILGVDVSTVRRMEARGQLHPKIGPGGIRYFETYEVRRLAAHRLRLLRSQQVEVKLAAFTLFREGADWRDVAIKLHHDPHDVRRLWELYNTEGDD